MKSATKAKVLREAVNRLLFLENLASKLVEVEAGVSYRDIDRGMTHMTNMTHLI